MTKKRAVVLVGGKGKRLLPYTVVLPKPLMPIGDYPILEVIIRQLVYYGFDHITLAINHQAEIIMAFFGNGEKWNVKIDYSIEDKPLSTMAPLKLIDDLPNNFLIMNGDVLTDLDFNSFYIYHTTNNNIFTISSYKRKQKSEYGVLEINNSKLVNFKEKPVTEYLVSMGIYMASKKILDVIPENKAYGFDHLMIDLITQNNPASVKIFNGFWLDIGNPGDYVKAIDLFKENECIFLKRE